MSAAVADTQPIPASTTPAPAASVVDTWAIERSRIDYVARGPVLGFFFSALLWLLIATFFGFLSNYKLQNPNFLADWPMYSYGRVVPAYNVAFTYGWCSLVGMGVAIWLMSRLCRTEIRFPGLLYVGGMFWNIGLVVALAALASSGAVLVRAGSTSRTSQR